MSEPRWVERPGGVRLPYVVLGSGDAPRLLFAHSLFAAGVAGAVVFSPIVDAGWTVLAMDQRGHGQAEGTWTDADFELDVLGADLLAILDDAGWATAWLGGGSLGAATSMAAAIAAPERAEGLLFMAPAIGPEPNPAIEAAFDTAAAAPAYEVALERLGTTGAPALRRALSGWTFGTLPSFDVPVITSAWEDDPVHPKATAVAIAEASPRGRFHPLDLAADPDFFAHVARQLTEARRE
jgi:pimeloyl-ACP methyl ester carboxylesterase